VILNLRKLSDLEVIKEYQIKISKSFAALENLNETEDINMALKTLKRISNHQLNRVWVCMN
jgi:hypothetical protein